MKKKFLGLMAIVVVASVAAWNVSQSKKEMTLTDVVMENVEALAGGENILDYQIYYVHAETSTQWTCTPGGSSACPAP